MLKMSNSDPSSIPKELLEERVARTMHRMGQGPMGETPKQIWRVYGFCKLFRRGITGARQNIATIVAFGSPTVEKDLRIFSRRFGLPPAKLKIHFPQGQPAQVDPGWALETAIDVQWAHALAPFATIHLVVAKDDTIGNLLGAVDFATSLDAQVVSMSWGDEENNVQPLLDFHFQHPGTVYVAASGDSGNEAPIWPALSPSVVAVGGTRLNRDIKGNFISETAWSDSGGGISQFFPEPDYQVAYGINTGPLPRRGSPDVAFVADPASGVAVFTSTPTDSGETGWLVVGGTSVSAPCWAAIIALADQIRKTPLTDGHRALYNLATGAKAYAKNYRDITIGSNGTCGPICNAGPGYDFVTGLGSPRVQNLVPGLRKQP
jgi:subtilase family serine protease